MKRSFYLLMISSIVLSISIACAGETETIVEEKIVEVEVEKIVEKEVEVEKIVEVEADIDLATPDAIAELERKVEQKVAANAESEE